MANSYAESVGRFYESLGQSGAAEEMRSSVLALIDQKANAYTDHIAKEGFGVNITDPDKQWLMQDDAYLAAQLRQNAPAWAGTLRRTTANGNMTRKKPASAKSCQICLLQRSVRLWTGGWISWML